MSCLADTPFTFPTSKQGKTVSQPPIFIGRSLRLTRVCLFTGAEDDRTVHRFTGNDSHTDYFRLVMRDGDSLVVGGRWVEVTVVVAVAIVEHRTRVSGYSNRERRPLSSAPFLERSDRRRWAVSALPPPSSRSVHLPRSLPPHRILFRDGLVPLWCLFLMTLTATVWNLSETFSLSPVALYYSGDGSCWNGV